MGFNNVIQEELPNFSFAKDRGYTIGVAYISNCTPKVTRNWKSLYFVVIDEMMIPKPIPKPAIVITIAGKRKINKLGLIIKLI